MKFIGSFGVGATFAIDIDFEEFEGANSFSEMLARLRERLSSPN